MCLRFGTQAENTSHIYKLAQHCAQADLLALRSSGRLGSALGGS
jgi:hypothetical protein